MTTMQPLESYYTAIRDAILGDNLSLAVETATAGFREHPGETEFIKIEIVALIKQEHPGRALDAIRKVRAAKLLPVKALQYEEAYCYFMLGKYDEAKVVLKNIKQSNSVDCLLAQIAYKCEQFSECIDIYKRLLSAAAPDSQSHNDLLLNLSAARAAKAQQDGKDSLGTAPYPTRVTYEFLFNSATRLLACDKIHEAIRLLNEASENAKVSLSALGWSADDIQNEVAPINAQKAVALLKLGKREEARSIYSDLLSQKNTDRITNVIAAHNATTSSLCASGYGGAAVGKAKRMLQIPGHSAGSLTRVQQAMMHYNMAVVLLRQNQHVSARRVLRLLGKRFSNVALPEAGAASATASLNAGNQHKALFEFSALSHVQDPVKGVFATLAATQIAIGLGNAKQGTSILREWLEKSRSVELSDPGTPFTFAYYYFGISVLTGWLTSEGGSIETIGPAASTAAEHLYSQFTRVVDPSPELLVAIGDCLAYSGDIEKARICFERAMAVGAQQSANMSLVLALGGGMESAQQILKNYNRRARVLRSVPGVCTRFARQFQPKANNRQNAAAGPSPHGATTSDSRKNSHSGKYRAQRLRKLRRNPPKDYDHTRKPDSERWIPLRQRSYYKPRGRNRRQQTTRGGAQGGVLEAGSGLGGTGSARISGKSASNVQQDQTKNDYGTLDIASSTTDAETGGSKQKSNKPKPKGKGKGKSKGKKGSW
ncbi:Srp72p [Coemansia sp. RSA 2559]|nr:Srp72p [Coemansia sp. RSA 2559]